jgi:hypothetical protein
LRKLTRRLSEPLCVPGYFQDFQVALTELGFFAAYPSFQNPKSCEKRMQVSGFATFQIAGRKPSADAQGRIRLPWVQSQDLRAGART